MLLMNHLTLWNLTRFLRMDRGAPPRDWPAPPEVDAGEREKPRPPAGEGAAADNVEEPPSVSEAPEAPEVKPEVASLSPS